MQSTFEAAQFLMTLTCCCIKIPLSHNFCTLLDSLDPFQLSSTRTVIDCSPCRVMKHQEEMHGAAIHSFTSPIKKKRKRGEDMHPHVPLVCWWLLSKLSLLNSLISGEFWPPLAETCMLCCIRSRRFTTPVVVINW